MFLRITWGVQQQISKLSSTEICISRLIVAVCLQASCVKVSGKGPHGAFGALPRFSYAVHEEKFGKTLEITDGQHFATLLQAEVPVLEPCQLVCKDGPMQPQFTEGAASDATPVTWAVRGVNVPQSFGWIVLGNEVECEANCGQEQLDLLSGGWTNATSTRKDMSKMGPQPTPILQMPPMQQLPVNLAAASQSSPEREIFTFTASKIGRQAGAQGTGPHRVRCFEDRMLVTQQLGNVTLPFKQITHAELDGKSCSIKLHLGTSGIGGADAGTQQFPPGLLRIELQNAADLAMLRQAVWPTLVRSLLRPGGNRSLFGRTCGPSLVWSHV
eukprot:s347_g24.t1